MQISCLTLIVILIIFCCSFIASYSNPNPDATGNWKSTAIGLNVFPNLVNLVDKPYYMSIRTCVGNNCVYFYANSKPNVVLYKYDMVTNTWSNLSEGSPNLSLWTSELTYLSTNLHFNNDKLYLTLHLSTRLVTYIYNTIDKKWVDTQLYQDIPITYNIKPITHLINNNIYYFVPGFSLGAYLNTLTNEWKLLNSTNVPSSTYLVDESIIYFLSLDDVPTIQAFDTATNSWRMRYGNINLSKDAPVFNKSVKACIRNHDIYFVELQEKNHPKITYFRTDVCMWVNFMNPTLFPIEMANITQTDTNYQHYKLYNTENNLFYLFKPSISYICYVYDFSTRTWKVNPSNITCCNINSINHDIIHTHLINNSVYVFMKRDDNVVGQYIL